MISSEFLNSRMTATFELNSAPSSWLLRMFFHRVLAIALPIELHPVVNVDLLRTALSPRG